MRINELLLDDQQLQEGIWQNLLAAVTLIASSSHLLPDQSIDMSNARPIKYQQHHVKTTPRPASVSATVDKIAKRYKVDAPLVQQIAQTALKYQYKDFPTAKDILGVIGTESSFNPKAVSGLKKDPARGLMQIRPGVWGMSPNDLRTIDDQIKVGAKILRTYYEKLGDREAALHAYNVGLTNYKTGRVLNPKYVTRVNYNKSMIESVKELSLNVPYFVDGKLTCSVIAPTAIYDLSDGTEIQIKAIHANHAYFFIRRGNFDAHAPLEYVKQRVLTKKEYDKKWLSGLKEEEHPLDLQIAKEMAVDHITEKGFEPWDEEEWEEHGDEYGDREMFKREMEFLYRNYKILDVHVDEKHPMFFNTQTHEFLIPVGFMFVDEDHINQYGDHGVSTLDREVTYDTTYNTDPRRVVWIKVDIDKDSTTQVPMLNDEIPQWERTERYKEISHLAKLHDNPEFMKGRLEREKQKFDNGKPQWVQITDADKIEEAAHPLDFQIACETAREFIIDHGHEVDPEDVDYHGGFPEKYDDWIIDNVHVDIYRGHGTGRFQDDQPAYYNQKIGAYIIPVTFDFKPSDPEENRGWYSSEATEWIMVSANGHAKKVNRFAYINKNAINDMIDRDDPRFGKIQDRLGGWREIYGHD